MIVELVSHVDQSTEILLIVLAMLIPKELLDKLENPFSTL
jgi:hypothetical protein